MEKTERDLLCELSRLANELSARERKRDRLLDLTDQQLDFLLNTLHAAEGLMPADKSDPFIRRLSANCGSAILGAHIPPAAYKQPDTV